MDEDIIVQQLETLTKSSLLLNQGIIQLKGICNVLVAHISKIEIRVFELEKNNRNNTNI